METAVVKDEQSTHSQNQKSNPTNAILKIRGAIGKLYESVLGKNSALFKRAVNNYQKILSKRKFKTPFGVNLFGYMSAELGIGEGARANARALMSAGIPFSTVNVSHQPLSRQNDLSLANLPSTAPIYRFNLFHMNADMLPDLCSRKRKLCLSNKYNIGYWVWELNDFPDTLSESFNLCGEIWTPSNFALKSISEKSTIPTFCMPHPIKVDPIKKVNRSYFQIKDEIFMFLFIFDFLSYFERKNPLDLIKAFKTAFDNNPEIQLVIKCINSNHDKQSLEIMKNATKDTQNIKIIDEYLNRDELNALMFHCDTYVSLHRSEGFGLTMAEAMYLGKPVIATAYSGNTDFMNHNNSFPVNYRLTEIKNDTGPYKKGGTWAQPDIDHAARLMRHVYRNPKEAKLAGEEASRHIQTSLSYEAVGKMIRNRLECL